MTIRAGAADADVRTRLREVALELFGRQGIEATSTRQIIAAAGLRNPSAINYHFGSKAKLVDDLLREVNRDQSRIIQQQVALAQQSPEPAPDEWATIPVDAAVGLLGSERGCYLVRVWADHDTAAPDAVEQFLGGDHPLAVAWRDAVARTFPDLEPAVAAARSVVVLRTLQWITLRRARRLLADEPVPRLVASTNDRAFLQELSRNLLAGPSALTGEPPWS